MNSPRERTVRVCLSCGFRYKPEDADISAVYRRKMCPRCNATHFRPELEFPFRAADPESANDQQGVQIEARAG